MKNENVIVDKSRYFAVRIAKLYRYIRVKYNENIMCKQLLRSGTSIGANVSEAIRGQSSADFYSKMNIALKEASETEYWLIILYESKYLTEKEYTSINNDCKELNRILTSIVKHNQK